MIDRELLIALLRPASMRRWNSFVSPIAPNELDKHAHKLIVAYVLGKLEAASGNEPSWYRLIQASLFEFLRQVVLPDIRSDVSEFLMRRSGEHVVKYVCDTLSPLVGGLSTRFWEDLMHYLKADSEQYTLERRIMRAASWVATYWEFEQLVYPFNPLGTRTEIEREAILRRGHEHDSLASMQIVSQMRDGTLNLRAFMRLCGELRYQQRWPQTPRVPTTSVLGHSYIVALLAFLFSDQGQPRYGQRRIYNNVFGGLFHDLGEAVTGDIISPVKMAAKQIDSAIYEFEQRELEARVMPCLPGDLQEDLRFWLHDVFENRTREGGQVRTGFPNASFDEEPQNQGDVLDGRLVGVCDDLAALMEADFSIRHGITSPDIVAGKRRLLERGRKGQITSQYEPDPALLGYLDKRGLLNLFSYFA